MTKKQKQSLENDNSLWKSGLTPSYTQTLEPRIMLDAAAVVTLAQGAEGGDMSESAEVQMAENPTPEPVEESNPALAQETKATDNVKTELVFIDEAVADNEKLLADLFGNHADKTSDNQFVLIEIKTTDAGIDKITDTLADYDNVAAIHILSHASEASIQLGNTQLNPDNLNDYSASLQSWQHSLTEQADILLYGCVVAGDDAGVEFVDNISELTQADVAASTDLTGTTQPDADWDLEYQTGHIEAGLNPNDIGTSWSGLLAAGPTASITVPSEELIENQVTFTVTFDNTGADAGFGPYVDMVIPAGIDGLSNGTLFNANDISLTTVATWDGTQWISGGNPVTEHPFDSSLAIPTGLGAGDVGATWTQFELPFGSYAPDQPSSSVEFTGTLDSASGAEVGVALDITVQAGFRFGEDALNNPSIDPPVQQGSAVTANTTPTVLSLTKNVTLPEDEVVSGPNSPFTYTLTIDIANGESVDSVILNDVIPDNLSYITNSLTIVNGSGTITDAPSDGAVINNTFSIDFGTVVGNSSNNDIVVTYQAFVPEVDASAVDVINATSGDDVAITNDANATGIHSSGPITADGPATDATITAKSLATQKGSSIAIDTGTAGVTPGDTLLYTINFQVSDFFAFDNLILADLLSDGLVFDTTFTPTFSVNENGVVTAGTFAASNFTNAPVLNADGTTNLQFNLSDQLVDSGADALLRGDLYQTDTNQQGLTQGTITYRAVIQQSFNDTTPSAPANPSIVLDDTVSNSITISGNVNEGVATEADTSSSSNTIIDLTSSKSIYAINGNTSFATAEIAPGEQITYRLTINLPTGDTEDLTVIDYLPLPVFDADDPTTGITAVSIGNFAGVPVSGDVTFGPSHTLPTNLNGQQPPTINLDGTNNSVTFDFGSFDDPGVAQPYVIDILFTITATDQPFVDGLQLTNLASVGHADSFTNLPVDNNVIQVTVNQPELVLTKGIVSVGSDVTGGTFDPTQVGPTGITFAAPSNVGVTFSGGAITSAGLAANPIDSNLNNVDNADTIRYAIVIENTGNEDAFDLLITDTLPAGITTPTNVQVYNGAGTLINFSGDLFGAGIELTDLGANGVIASSTDGALTGTNIIIVTYDAVVSSLNFNSQHVNTAELAEYSAIEGGNDFTNGNTGSWDDDAIVTIANPTVNKTLISTSINTTNNSNTQAVIGETAQYQVVTTVPEGVMQLSELQDRLDFGLSFVSFDSIVASPGLSTSAGNFDLVDISVSTSLDGQNRENLTFDLGTVTNSNTDNTTSETITLTYTALVINDVANQSGDRVNNRAAVAWDLDGNAGTTNDIQTTGFSSATNIRILEPVITIDNSVSPTTGEANESVTYTVTLTNTGGTFGTDGFDLTFTDSLPTDYTASGFTVIHSADGDISSSFEITAGNVLQTIAGQSFDVDVSETVTITINGAFATTIQGNEVLTADADVQWTSIDGANANERTGTGGVNDYTTSDSATFTVDSPAVNKTLLGTGITTTNNNSADEVVIGETAQYQLVITLPESTMNSVNIVDSLDLGLALVSFDGISASAGITSSIDDFTNQASFNPGTSGDGSSTAQTLTFDLGNVINNANNPGNETITITYTVRVLNASANQAGDNLDNAAQFTWNNGSAQQTTAVNAAALNVLEPDLIVTKTVDTPVGDASNTPTFTMIIQHSTATDNTDAFDVTFSDAIPSELSVDFVNDVTIVHSTLGNIKSLFELSGNTLQTISGQSFDLAVGETVTITLPSAVTGSALTGAVINNIADIQWTSINGTDANERTGSGGVNDYTDNDNATFTIDSPSISKSLTSTTITSTNNTNSEVVIGESARYTVVITLPEGISNNFVLVDNLDVGLSFDNLVSITASSVDISSSIDSFANTSSFNPGSSGNGINSSQALTFNLGNLTNTNNNNNVIESLTLVYDVNIVDAVTVDRGDNLDNSVQATWQNGSTNTADAEDITVIEPELIVNKTVGTLAGADSNLANYTVVISHSGNSDADAQEVSLVDTISNGTLDLGSINVLGATVANDSSTTGELNLEFTTLAIGDTITITYQVALTGNFDQTINNTANISWDSLPGGGGRTDNTSDNANITLSNPTITKALVATSSTTTSLDDLVIGETATFHITVSFPAGTSNGNLIITDNLPTTNGILSVVSSRVVSIGNSITGATLNVNDSGVASDSNLSDGFDDRVIFNFGTITNTADGVNDSDDTLVVEVVARLENVASNQDGDTLTNTALHNQPGTNTSDTATVDVIEPTLQINQVVDDTTPTLNQTVTFTATITNPSASSNHAGYDLNIQQSLPTELTLNIGSISVVGANIDQNTSSGNNINLTLDQLALDGTITITYQALVSSAAADIGDNLMPPINLTWTDLPGADPNERTGSGGVNDYADNSTPSLTLVNPDLSITKDDGITAVSPGDSTTYTLTITNSGTSEATNVEVNDLVPSGLTILSTTPSVGSVNIVGSDITWTVGNLAISAVETLQIQVSVDNPAPAGIDNLTNTATITSTTPNYIEPTPGNNTDNDINTLDAVPNYTITKTDGATFVTADDMLNYSLVVSNIGNQTGTNVVIVDTYPTFALNNITNVSNGGIVNETAGTITWNFAQFIGNTSVNLSYSATVRSDIPAGITDYTNTVTVTDDGNNGPDPDPSNNTDTDTNSLGNIPDYAITIVTDQGFVFPNDRVTYTITISNVGNQDGTGVVATGTFDLSVLNIINPDGGTINGNQVEWVIGDLAVNQTVVKTVTTTVRLDAGGVTSFTETVSVVDDGANGPEVTLVNNQDDVTNELGSLVGDQNILLGDEGFNAIEEHFRSLPPRDITMYYLHGRLISLETISDNANLMGGRALINYDADFGQWSYTLYPDMWSLRENSIITTAEHDSVRSYVNWGAYNVSFYDTEISRDSVTFYVLAVHEDSSLLAEQDAIQNQVEELLTEHVFYSPLDEQIDQAISHETLQLSEIEKAFSQIR